MDISPGNESNMNPPVPFIPFAPHHLYLGIMIVLYGMLMIPHRIYKPIMIILFITGIILIIDDIIEHTITGSTPIRLLFIFLRETFSI